MSIKSADLNQIRKKSIDNLRKVWLSTEGSNISEQLYLALELYTSSQFENSERAKLIGIISAIESLAKQKDYSQDENYNIDSVIMGLCEELDTHKTIPGPIRKSIEGQIRNLNRELIRRACHRLINSQLPEYNYAIDIFERAYSARSKLLHEGETTYDLLQISYEIQELVRNLLLTFLPSE